MATELRTNNTRSPRFSTSKALGFKGGSTGPNGNLQQPTMQQLEGTVSPTPSATAPADTAATTDAKTGGPAISQFSAQPLPKAPGVGSGIATTAAGAVAGEGVRSGLSTLKDKLNLGASAGRSFVGPPTGTIQPPGLQESGATTYAVSDPNVGLESRPLGGDGPVLGDAGVDQSMFDGSGADLSGGGGVDQLTGGGAGADLLGDAVGDSIPYVGPLLQASQGNYGGAAGSAVGGAIGSAIFPGVGTAIGSFLGSQLGGGCFITEAVMSAGGAGDTAPELEALRQFRDQTLAATPQGQALIAEYEAIAPIVVEAIMNHPDNMAIFQSIDAQFINPAVAAIQSGDVQKALQIYAQMISFVTPYAAEGATGGMPGDTGDADAMEGMGEHAAILGHDAGMTAELTGQMAIDHTGPYTDNDPNGYDGGPNPDSPMQQGGAQVMQNTFAQSPPRY